jgi:hypothetical protein
MWSESMMNLPVSIGILSNSLLENIQFHMEPLLVADGFDSWHQGGKYKLFVHHMVV